MLYLGVDLIFLDLVGPLWPRRGVSTLVRHDFDTLLSQLHRYDRLTRSIPMANADIEQALKYQK